MTHSNHKDVILLGEKKKKQEVTVNMPKWTVLKDMSMDRANLNLQQHW